MPETAESDAEREFLTAHFMAALDAAEGQPPEFEDDGPRAGLLEARP